MKQNVLIAEPCEVLRIGLRTIFQGDERVSNVYEVSTFEGLRSRLHTATLDMIIVNQSLLKEIAILAKGNFVILAEELDLAVMKAAYKYGVRGYLSENSSSELLQLLLSPTRDFFLLDPTLAHPILEVLFEHKYPFVKDELLTRREREIVSLLREGVDRRSIAKRLQIAETTLKTHIKNIAQKREKGPMDLIHIS